MAFVGDQRVSQITIFRLDVDSIETLSEKYLRNGKATRPEFLIASEAGEACNAHVAGPFQNWLTSPSIDSAA